MKKIDALRKKAQGEEEKKENKQKSARGLIHRSPDPLARLGDLKKRERKINGTEKKTESDAGVHELGRVAQ